MLDSPVRPSELLGIDDEYTAFCFDEACAFIISKIQDGEQPIIGNKETSSAHEYTKPSDLYKKYQK